MQASILDLKKKSFSIKTLQYCEKVKKKKRFEKKCIFDSRSKTIFGGYLEFRRHFNFWGLVIFFLFFPHPNL
jgi:hypothetical protein